MIGKVKTKHPLPTPPARSARFQNVRSFSHAVLSGPTAHDSPQRSPYARNGAVVTYQRADSFVRAPKAHGERPFTVPATSLQTSRGAGSQDGRRRRFVFLRARHNTSPREAQQASIYNPCHKSPGAEAARDALRRERSERAEAARTQGHPASKGIPPSFATAHQMLRGNLDSNASRPTSCTATRAPPLPTRSLASPLSPAPAAANSSAGQARLGALLPLAHRASPAKRAYWRHVHSHHWHPHQRRQPELRMGGTRSRMLWTP